MPSTGETVGQGRRQEFLTKLAECGSVKLAAKHAKVSRQTLYGLRNHDPEFRRLWDEAPDLGDLALEDEAYQRSIIGGSDGMLKFVLQKRLPERVGEVSEQQWQLSRVAGRPPRYTGFSAAKLRTHSCNLTRQ